MHRASKTPTNVTNIFFNTAFLLPKDLGFEHEAPNVFHVCPVSSPLAAALMLNVYTSVQHCIVYCKNRVRNNKKQTLSLNTWKHSQTCSWETEKTLQLSSYRASQTMGRDPIWVAKCNFGVANKLAWQIRYKGFCNLFKKIKSRPAV